MKVILCGIMLLAMTVARVAAQEKPAILEGTVIEVGPSPYADRGGVGRIMTNSQRNGEVIVHILKDTKIFQMVDGKDQAVKFAALGKDCKIKVTFDGKFFKTNPPQIYARRLEIVDEKTVDLKGTVTEIRPSPNAEKGGVGRVKVTTTGNRRMIVHIMKNTKIIRMVNGKEQPAKFGDLAKDAKVRVTYNGEELDSRPPQIFALRLEISDDKK